MATILAQADGNASNTATWAGGVVPGPGDDADLVSYAVTVDFDWTCANIINSAAGTLVLSGTHTLTANLNASGGKMFAMSSGNITINGLCQESGTYATGYSTGAFTLTGGTLNINGNLENNSTGAADPVEGYFAMVVNGGTVNIDGDVIATTMGTNGAGIIQFGGAVSIIGDLRNLAASMTAYYQVGGQLYVNGDLYNNVVPIGPAPTVYGPFNYHAFNDSAAINGNGEIGKNTDYPHSGNAGYNIAMVDSDGNDHTTLFNSFVGQSPVITVTNTDTAQTVTFRADQGFTDYSGGWGFPGGNFNASTSVPISGAFFLMLNSGDAVTVTISTDSQCRTGFALGMDGGTALIIGNVTNVNGEDGVLPAADGGVSPDGTPNPGCAITVTSGVCTLIGNITNHSAGGCGVELPSKNVPPAVQGNNRAGIFVWYGGTSNGIAGNGIRNDDGFVAYGAAGIFSGGNKVNSGLQDNSGLSSIVLANLDQVLAGTNNGGADGTLVAYADVEAACAAAITASGVQKAVGATGDDNTTKAPGEAGGLFKDGANAGPVSIASPGSSNVAALTLTGDGTGQGFDIQGGAGADGIRTRSGASAGFGVCSAGYQGGGRFWGNGDQAPGLSIYSTVGDAHGISIQGNGAGSGVYTIGGLHGIFAIGGASGVDSHGIAASGGSGANGRGIVATGQNAAPGMQIDGGTSGSGLQVNAGASGGTGIAVTAAAGNGMEITARDQGLYIQAGASGVYISGSNVGIIIFGNYGIEVCAANGPALYGWSQSNDAVQLFPGANASGLHIWGGYTSGDCVKLKTVGTGSVFVPAAVDQLADTKLGSWLGLLAGKGSDPATLAEVNATLGGATFDNATDSEEAIAEAVAHVPADTVAAFIAANAPIVIAVASPIIQNQDLQLTPVVFSDDGTWPTLTETKCAVAPLGDQQDALFTFDAVTSGNSPNQIIKLEFPPANTSALVPGAAYTYQVKTAVGNSNTEIRTLIGGQITMSQNIQILFP